MRDLKAVTQSRTIWAWVALVLTYFGDQAGVVFPDLNLPGAVGVALNWLFYLALIAVPVFRYLATHRLTVKRPPP